ncbi:MAG: AraC family transcriptional regulator [Ruminococcaceae bacterium]|nr:AraC family transcriptional regulator [Oscillospiraceae bacterium]
MEKCFDTCNVNFEIEKKNRQSLRPLSAGEQHCPPKHTWGAGVRSYMVVHYIISGKGTFYCGTNKFSLGAGDMFFIFPNTIVKYQADKEDPWHYAWINFSGDDSQEILSHIGVSVRNPVLKFGEGSSLLPIMRAMPRDRSDNRAENLHFASLLYEFMSLILKNRTESEESETTYFSIATHFIKNHFSDAITVSDIAAHVRINRKYLHCVFKKSCGKSPKEYIIEYRMKKACEFLHEPELSISNIAYSVGYSDPLMFSKMFKRKTGKSPTEYRKAIRNS